MRSHRNGGSGCMMRTGSSAGGKTGQGALNGVSCGTSKVLILWRDRSKQKSP